MTFTLPSNRLSVADTDAILRLAKDGRTALAITCKLSRSGTQATSSEIEKVCREQGVSLRQARAAS